MQPAALKRRSKYGGALQLSFALVAVLALLVLLQDCMHGMGVSAQAAAIVQLSLPHRALAQQADTATAGAQEAVVADQHGRPRNPPGPLSSNASCEAWYPDPAVATPKELHLQQQRRCLAGQPGWDPPGGYLAICASAKDQHRDLPEWLDYHRRLGVSHFYVMDDGSSPPLDGLLAPYEGWVTHRFVGTPATLQQQLHAATCRQYSESHRQLMHAALCLHDYGHRHQWMAFTAVDEFFVFNDATDDLPALLHDYEAHGGLTVNWRVFGSSGHRTRQANTLTAFTQCYDWQDKGNLWVKTVAQPRFLTSMLSPHHGAFAPGYSAVSSSGNEVEGARSEKPHYKRLALHHYAVRSRDDFLAAKQRSTGMGEPILSSWYRQLDANASATCKAGAEAWRRLYGGADTAHARVGAAAAEE